MDGSLRHNRPARLHPVRPKWILKSLDPGLRRDDVIKKLFCITTVILAKARIQNATPMHPIIKPPTRPHHLTLKKSTPGSIIYSKDNRHGAYLAGPRFNPFTNSEPDAYNIFRRSKTQNEAVDDMIT